ncbi:GNAT family N-acetyltransferase [Loktanella sp. SALINAS62]|uniref:GNAT family N-acetyltransferase n=1 Tax=Loktanella sp. SALINAS62 TaxID=2706124 RepID=UPI001B8BD659|nr:GNAT family N-acetyltransferase [Loktanella sp. SALINAS62]MBS1300944.1 GNAT family N-acetyltransferase [Loktanella sp. SALINAS62]
MTLKVAPADPRSPDARRLLGASHAYLLSKYPPEASFALSVDELAAPHIRFLLVHDDSGAIGCGALANKGTYGELKSMFVDPAARGSGAGGAIVAALISAAREQGLPMLKLETGDDLYPAHRLYARNGFTPCGPFGDYAKGPHSIFMERAL